MDGQHIFRKRPGMNDQESLAVRKEGNELLVLRRDHDGHQNDGERGLIGLHFEGCG